MSPLVHALKRAGLSLRHLGAGETFLKCLHRFRVISVLHSLDMFYEEIKNLRAFAAPERSNPYPMREITAEELDTLKLAQGMYSPATMLLHFKNGLRLFAAFADGAVVAVSGVHTRFAHLTFLKRPWIQLPEGTVYLNCASTAPAYRRLGISSQLRCHIIEKMNDEGSHGIVLASFVDHLGAKRWHRKQGFQEWGRISYIRWGTRDFWWTRLTSFGRKHRALFGTSSEHPFPLEHGVRGFSPADNFLQKEAR